MNGELKQGELAVIIGARTPTAEMNIGKVVTLEMFCPFGAQGLRYEGYRVEVDFTDSWIVTGDNLFASVQDVGEEFFTPKIKSFGLIESMHLMPLPKDEIKSEEKQTAKA